MGQTTEQAGTLPIEAKISEKREAELGDQVCAELSIRCRSDGSGSKREATNLEGFLRREAGGARKLLPDKSENAILQTQRRRKAKERASEEETE